MVDMLCSPGLENILDDDTFNQDKSNGYVTYIKYVIAAEKQILIGVISGMSFDEQSVSLEFRTLVNDGVQFVLDCNQGLCSIKGVDIEVSPVTRTILPVSDKGYFIKRCGCHDLGINNRDCLVVLEIMR